MPRTEIVSHPDWCDPDVCRADEDGSRQHGDEPTVLTVRSGMVGLPPDELSVYLFGSDHRTVPEVMVAGHSLTPALARQLAAALLEHADRADGITTR